MIKRQQNLRDRLPNCQARHYSSLCKLPLGVLTSDLYSPSVDAWHLFILGNRAIEDIRYTLNQFDAANLDDFWTAASGNFITIQSLLEIQYSVSICRTLAMADFHHPLDQRSTDQDRGSYSPAKLSVHFRFVRPRE